MRRLLLLLQAHGLRRCYDTAPHTGCPLPLSGIDGLSVSLTLACGLAVTWHPATLSPLAIRLRVRMIRTCISIRIELLTGSAPCEGGRVVCMPHTLWNGGFWAPGRPCYDTYLSSAYRVDCSARALSERALEACYDGPRSDSYGIMKSRTYVWGGDGHLMGCNSLIGLV